METEVETFLDLLIAYPKAILGTSETYVKWNIEERCFDGWQGDVLLWSIPFGDRDPSDVERDVAIKLWQAIG